ncbi:complement component receptor 1-like protein [Erinaceus europaeus]|uniref:Complement component receptor 1-like protein n=1 Tax=Erinaceus europaeus TaxID=9365 RepID=A0ABM3WCM6_ERIEU|nr:complement component receptor 1-like protein [Erinaceus europaeus]
MCPQPPDIPHGEHTAGGQDQFSPGQEVTYRCQPGYDLSGAAFLHCTAGGTWSPAAPRCTGRPCPDFPGPLPNGRLLRHRGLQLGAQVTFSCDEGFHLRGSAASHCVLVGGRSFWNSSLPVCERILCPRPPDVPHGSHSGKALLDFAYGTEVAYTCGSHPDTGASYLLVGEPTLRCLGDSQGRGVWSGPGPRCDPPPPAVCPQPPDIPHGEHTAGGQDQFSPGQEVTYRCQPGYDLSGAAFLHCTAGGTWSPAAPRCTGRPCPDFPGPLPNGRLLRHRGLQLGAQVTFSCDEGFHLRGSAASHCVLVGGRSFWNSSLPVCERILCPRPPDVPHGSHSGEALLDFAYGTEVAYTCGSHPDTGAPYLLVGEPTLRCLGDSQGRGVWSGPGPRCDPPPPADLPLVCPPPPEMLNGHRIGQQEGPFLPGMTVQYSCSPGFRLAGHNTIFCTHRGTWSQPSLSCQEVNCSLPQFLNGLQKDFEAGKVYHYGDNVTLHCEEGFSREGSPWSQCLEDSWTPPLASCVPRPGDSFLVGMTAGVALFLLPVIIACGVMARCRKSSNEYGKCRDVTIHLHPQEDSERVQPQTEHTAQENRGVCGMAAAMQADSPQLSPD